MKSNRACGWCGAAVRDALVDGERPIVLDPVPTRDGYIWVYDYGVTGTPDVRIAGSSLEVPASEATTYVAHRCLR